jgi:hypothetical protein
MDFPNTIEFNFCPRLLTFYYPFLGFSGEGIGRGRGVWYNQYFHK